MSDKLPTIWKADPHTLAKHAILKNYLNAWLPIMTRQAAALKRRFGSQRREILFVDAFAGPGEYQGGEPGSPVIALQTAMTHAVSFPYPVRLVFNELDKARFQNLQKVVAKEIGNYGESNNVIVDDVRNSTCEAVIADLLKEAEARGVAFGPALVFLDQFGFSAAPLDLIKTILAFPSCETFTLIDFKNMNRWINDADKADAFTRAFGGEEWRDCASFDEQQMRDCLLERYVAALQDKDRGGAKYVYSFAMFGRDERLLYRLVFCTGNLRGLEEMKKAMWKVDDSGECRFSDRNDPGALRLLKVAFDQDWLADELVSRLGGRTLTAKDVEEFVLVHTPCRLFRQALKKLEAKIDSGMKVVAAPTGRRPGTFPKEMLDQIRIRFDKRLL